MKKITEKYSSSVLEQLDKKNSDKIISFLANEKCDYIEDIICDYLDLFSIKYDDFVLKYNKLNKKYNGSFLKKASENMNLLEKFYTV